MRNWTRVEIQLEWGCVTESVRLEPSSLQNIELLTE